MIDVKAAVKIAFEYLDMLFSNETIFSPRLEEIEYHEEDHTWVVTISFLRQPPAATTTTLTEKISEMYNFEKKYEREYKLIRINADTGQVLSMKIRQLTV